MKTNDESITEPPDAEHLAARMLEVAVSLAGATHGALLRLDRATSTLRVIQTHGPAWLNGKVSLNAAGAEPAPGVRGPKSDGTPARVLCGAWNVHGGIAVQVASSSLPAEIGYSFAVPVLTDGQMWGVVTLHSATELRCDGRVVTAIGDLARLGADVFALQEREQARRAESLDQMKHAARLALLGESMASVMHEINNPLTAVMGFASLVQHTAPQANAENRKALKAIVSEAHRAAAIVRDVLNFSRRNDREPPELVDLNHLLDQLTMLRRISHRQLGINFGVVRAPEPALVEGRGAQLLQILLNLVVNAEQAISAHRNDGVITLRIEAVDGSWHVLVADNGPGVPHEAQTRLFEPFFTTKPAGKGSGLGLSTSRALAAEHRGELRLVATSRSGTVFLLALPRVASPGGRVEPTVKPASATVGAGARVLLVDESVAVHETAMTALRPWNICVETATDGLTALRRVQECDFDFVLSDTCLPGGMDGWRLGQTLGEMLPRYRARFGCLLTFPDERAFRGDIPCLAKPFAMERLAQFVHECLAQAATASNDRAASTATGGAA